MINLLKVFFVNHDKDPLDTYMMADIEQYGKVCFNSV